MHSYWRSHKSLLLENPSAESKGGRAVRGEEQAGRAWRSGEWRFAKEGPPTEDWGPMARARRTGARQLFLVAVQAGIMWEVWHLEVHRAESNKLLKIRFVRAVDAMLVLAKHKRAKLIKVVSKPIKDGRVSKNTAV